MPRPLSFSRRLGVSYVCSTATRIPYTTTTTGHWQSSATVNRFQVCPLGFLDTPLITCLNNPFAIVIAPTPFFRDTHSPRLATLGLINQYTVIEYQNFHSIYSDEVSRLNHPPPTNGAHGLAAFSADDMSAHNG